MNNKNKILIKGIIWLIIMIASLCIIAFVKNIYLLLVFIPTYIISIFKSGKYFDEFRRIK